MDAVPRKHREILRYVHALMVIVLVSVTLLVTSLVVSQVGERRLRERLGQFHLRALMLTTEVSEELTDLQQDTPARAGSTSGALVPDARLQSDRMVGSAVYAIGRSVESIARLHRDWKTPVDPYSKTVERAERQYRRLRDVMGPDRQARAEFSTAVTALKLTFFQLDRLHSIASDELLDQIATTRQSETLRTAIAVGLALLVSGMLIAHILTLLRTRLREHERTEQILLDRERQLRQSSKMEALGTLAGGVAHDFNNLLTAILGNVELLLEETGPGDRRQRSLLQVRRAGERAASLTTQLLAYSRNQAADLRIVDLNLLIRDMGPMLRRLIREDIELVLRLDADCAKVRVDPVQMEQVLINLVVNARDAMQRGGALTVQTFNVQVDPGQVDRASLSQGSYVSVCVEDTGCGIAPEVLPRVFDPFFTTKEHGKGTGLGLSTVHGIVTASGGDVLVQSQDGVGTRFEAYLPRSEEPITDWATEAERGEAGRSPVCGGWETVLVAEDEPQVRELTVTALRQAGYRVLEAGDGVEALRMCAEHRGPLHLILADVVMPGMRGPELADRALELHPSARVLFVSGYTGDELFDGAACSDAPLLVKPFKLQQLLTLVRRELDAARIEAVGVEHSA